MALKPYEQFLTMAKELNQLLDAGASVIVEETVSHVRDGTLFEWLPARLSDYYAQFDELGADDRSVLLDFFRPFSVARVRADFRIENNGLAFLLACCLAGLRRKPAYFED